MKKDAWDLLGLVDASPALREGREGASLMTGRDKGRESKELEKLGIKGTKETQKLKYLIAGITKGTKANISRH